MLGDTPGLKEKNAFAERCLKCTVFAERCLKFTAFAERCLKCTAFAERCLKYTGCLLKYCYKGYLYNILK